MYLVAYLDDLQKGTIYVPIDMSISTNFVPFDMSIGTNFVPFDMSIGTNFVRFDMPKGGKFTAITSIAILVFCHTVFLSFCLLVCLSGSRNNLVPGNPKLPRTIIFQLEMNNNYQLLVSGSNFWFWVGHVQMMSGSCPATRTNLKDFRV